MPRPTFMWPLAPATLMLVPLLARAGEVVPPSVANDFPGWAVAEFASGDLNGDGRSDTALTLRRQDRDEGQAALAVYLAGDKGQRLQFRALKAVCIGCAGPKGSPDMVVGTPAIAKGVLNVNYFGGSREVWNYLGLAAGAREPGDWNSPGEPGVAPNPKQPRACRLRPARQAARGPSSASGQAGAAAARLVGAGRPEIGPHFHEPGWARRGKREVLRCSGPGPFRPTRQPCTVTASQ